MPMGIVTNRPPTACQIATFAVNALKLEVLTWPKPGLVSHVDSGSHHDMNATTLFASAEALRPYFAELFEAAATDAPLHKLQSIGRFAEKSMLIATCGVNTHRGAVFTLGLLCQRREGSLDVANQLSPAAWCHRAGMLGRGNFLRTALSAESWR